MKWSQVESLNLRRQARAGKLALDPLLTRTYAIDEINEAYAAMEGGELAGALIVYD
jgi:S-(hydroxymethyl)glutathione dehydrogenase/alcohol dehydrogenase